MNKLYTLFYAVLIVVGLLSIDSLHAVDNGNASTIEYVPIAHVRPGQPNYSEKNVQEKLKKFSHSIQCNMSGKRRKITLPYDEGKSLLAPTQALPVVRVNNRSGDSVDYLGDGHHDFLALLRAGTKTVPVKVVDQWYGNETDEFYEWATAKNYIYPLNIQGSSVPLPDTFTKMTDEPQRWLISLLSRKYTKTTDSSGKHQYSSTSAAKRDTYPWRYPVIIKYEGKGVEKPFLEFIAGAALLKKGMSYTYDMGDNLTKDFVELARSTLTALKIQGELAGIKVVTQKTDHELINPDDKQYRN
jgi:hypothetical protein